MVKHMPVNPKSTPMTSASASVQRPALFGTPLLLPGEDAAAITPSATASPAATKPVDIIDEMFVDDLVSFQWEVLRWRRCKAGVISAIGRRALAAVLNDAIDFDFFADAFRKDVVEALLTATEEEALTEKAAKELAQHCFGDERFDRVNKLLEPIGRSVNFILSNCRAKAARNLAEDYAANQTRAVNLVQELLETKGRTMDELLAQALEEELISLNRLDHQASTAETRRNATLREMSRRREALGEARRRSVQDIEDGEYEVIETMPAKGKSAA